MKSVNELMYHSLILITEAVLTVRKSVLYMGEAEKGDLVSREDEEYGNMSCLSK